MFIVFRFSRGRSCVCIAPSMAGKTYMWLKVLSNLEIFQPRPSRVYLYGHRNLEQFEPLRSSYSEGFVCVLPIADLVSNDDRVFESNAFILVDEVQAGSAAMSAQDAAKLNSKLMALLNEGCHHGSAFVLILLQTVFKTRYFSFLSAAQSVCLGTLSSRAQQILGHLGLDEDQYAAARAALSLLSSVCQFIIVYNNPNIQLVTTYPALIFSHLDFFGHFVVAYGNGKKALLGANDMMDDGDSDDGHYSVDIPDAKAAEALEILLDEASRHPEEAKRAHVMLPLSSIRSRSEEEREARRKELAAAEESAAPTQEALLHERVMRRLEEDAPYNELNAYKRFWNALITCPSISVDDDMILYCEEEASSGRSRKKTVTKRYAVNLLDLVRECAKKSSGVVGAKKGTKVKASRAAQSLNAAVLPFVRILLRCLSFPKSYIRNARLKALASRAK